MMFHVGPTPPTIITGMRWQPAVIISEILTNAGHSWVSMHQLRIAAGDKVNDKHEFASALSAPEHVKLIRSIKGSKYLLWCREYDDPVVKEVARLFNITTLTKNG